MDTIPVKSKLEGIRKMGIAMGAVTALTVKNTIDFKIALIICGITITAIICQTILDWRKNNGIQ